MKKKIEPQSPPDIAREAFRRLATRRIAPTPNAYRDIYEEIAGIKEQHQAEKVLADFAANLSSASEEMARFALSFTRALEVHDWSEYGKNLTQLIEKHLKQPPANAASTVTAPLAQQVRSDSEESSLARTRSISLINDGEPDNASQQSFPLVDDLPAFSAKPKPLTDSSVLAPLNGENPQADMLRNLLTRTLTLAVGSLLHGAPELAQESESLAALIKEARTEPLLSDISARLKQLCYKIELRGADMAEEHELLLRLFQLLLENVSELLEDDSWLSGQIASVQNILAGPISHSALMDATYSLKEVIYKQGLIKHSLTEAKSNVKNMMMTFIDRLSAVAENTSDYHEKIDKYAQKISNAKGITELNSILEDVMRDTKAAQMQALRVHDEMGAVRQNVQDAETRIHELENQLKQMSELVREDQLTGSLNRRGLDDVFKREFARSERRQTPLCIALLDLDDFKRLNDTHGHTVGDEALIHLVKVVKDTLRTMDVIGRFGGEEFLIVLPETPLDAAVQTVTRVQRELTKRIFMHGTQKLLITFSAGVALRVAGEEQAALTKRADDALYKAKRAGKNRVVAAE